MKSILRILFSVFLVIFQASAGHSETSELMTAESMFLQSENWTLRLIPTDWGEKLNILSLRGEVLNEDLPTAFVQFCLENAYFSFGFFVLPNEQRFLNLSPQTAEYKIRDDIFRKMPMLPVRRFPTQYSAALRGIAPNVKPANLIAIKYPGYFLSTLFNLRKGGRYLVRMKDRNEKPFELRFAADGLKALEALSRKKCGW